MTVARASERLRVGLDVGGTKVLGVLLDGDRVRRTLRLPTQHGIDGVVGTAARAVRELCAAHGVEPGALAGVGLCLPGIVDPRTGTVSHAVNLLIDEPSVPVGPLLSSRLGGVPVAVENDLNAAALGAADVLGLDDMALLALGTGLAAGLVLDGRLRRGHAGAAGEIGHLPYLPGGALCACGQRGCLEVYASGSALDAAWAASHPGTDARDLFAAVTAGDPAAIVVLDRFADAVATAVRFLVLGADVEHVVLGGGVAQGGEPLRAAVVAAVERHVAGSPFLRSLAIPERVALVPPGVPVGPIGAALATHGDTLPGHREADGMPQVRFDTAAALDIRAASTLPAPAPAPAASDLAASTAGDDAS